MIALVLGQSRFHRAFKSPLILHTGMALREHGILAFRQRREAMARGQPSPISVMDSKP